MFEVLGLGAEFTFDARGTERISDIVGDLQTLSNQMSLSAADTQRYSNTLLDFGNVIGDMGKQLMIAGSATTGAALYGVGKAAAWQTEMISASRYMTDTSAEAQNEYNLALKETAQLLGVTKEEINKATVSYMMMGKSTDDALRLAKNAGYAAVTWDMAADEVSDSFRSIKAAFNVNLEDQDMYQRYLDTINEVGNSTAATSRDVVEFLADGGAALHNVANVSMEEAMGMASAARYANMSIAEFSTMMTRLGNQYALDKSSDYFKKLGVEVKDADGKMRSFAQVLYDVQKQWNDLDQASKSEFAAGVGGVYADRLSLYLGSAEEFQKGNQIAGQDNTGSAEAEFQRVTNTFNLAIARFKVTLSDFGQAFWGTLLPPLTKFVNVVNTIITKISDFMQAHPVIMKIVASVILLTGVTATLAGVFLVVSGALTKLYAGLVLNHTAGLRTINIFRGLGTVFKGLSGQITKLIPQFGKMALSIGLIYIAWKYDFFNIRSMFEEFMGKMKNSLETTKKLLDNGLSVKDFRDQIQSLNNSDSVFDKLTLALTKVGLAFKGLGEYIKEGSLSDDMFQKLNAMGLMPFISVVIGLGMRFKALWDGIKEGFINTVETINTWIKDHLGPPFQWLHDNILLPVAKAFFGVDESVTDLGEAIDGIQFVDLDAMFGPIESWEKFGKVIGTIAAGFLMLSSAVKLIKGVGTVISVIGKIGSVVGKVIGLIGKIGPAISGLVSWFGSIGPAIGSAISSIGSFFSWLGSGIMWILGGIGTVVTAILGFFGIVVTLPAWVVGAITVAVVAVIALVVHFREEIWNFLTVTLPNAIGVAIDWIVNFFTVTIPNALQVAGEWLYTLFTDTIPSAIGYGIGWIAGNVYLFFTETLPGWISTAVDAIGHFFTETLPEFIGNAIDAIGEFFTVTLPQVVGDAINAIGNFFTVTLPEAIATGLEAIRVFFTETLPQWFAELPEKLMEIGQNIIQGLVDGIESMWTAITTAVGNFVDGIVQGFKDALGIHSPSTVFSDIGINLIQGLINGITSMVGAIGEAIGSVVSLITDTIGGLIDSAAEWGSNLIGNITDGIGGAIDWVGEKAGQVGDFFKNGWDTVTSTASEWGSNAVDFISGGIDSAASWVGDRATDVGNFFRDGWDSVTSTASEWGSNAVNFISGGIDSAKSFVSTKATELGGLLHNGWNTITSTASEWGSTAINNLVSGISAISPSLGSTVSGMIDNVSNTITGLRDKAMEFGSNMISQYKQGIENGKTPVQSAISTITDTVKTTINSIKDSAVNWGSNLVSGFADGIRNAASKATSAASSVINSVKNYLGFNSPAKMGEGQHIVEWGYNMISGFSDGIESANGLLQDTVANVITNPMNDILQGNANLPISTSLDSQISQTLNADTNLTGYLGQIVSLLTTIAQSDVSIIPSQTEGSNGSISNTPMETIQERVNRVEQLTTENNTREMSINISSGAIENHFHIEGSSSNEETKEKLMQFIEDVMDENLLPLLMQKINELKVVLNE